MVTKLLDQIAYSSALRPQRFHEAKLSFCLEMFIYISVEDIYIHTQLKSLGPKRSV